MKKIGFIDYYLDEWHANNYPRMVAEQSGGAWSVAYAYGKIDAPGGMTNDRWAQAHGVVLLPSVEEVVERSDALVVLAPDNPETHEELAFLPLQSGKPVYIDKVFAPDAAAARRMFDHAASCGTVCYSSSALRFAPELARAKGMDIRGIGSQGPGNLSVYAIHQIEPIVMLMRAAPRRVMYWGEESLPSLVIEFEDGRCARLCQYRDASFEFTAVDGAGRGTRMAVQSDFFAPFIQEMLRFFETGDPPVAPEETVSVIAVRAAGIAAAKTPCQWEPVGAYSQKKSR